MQAAAIDSPAHKAAIEYATKFDWNVVALYPRTKKPIGNEWHIQNATTDPDKIDQFFSDYPAANLGVLLGPKSGLIDAECDDDEQERALAELFGGEFPLTPSFLAGRGKHRLFKFREDFPMSDDKGIVYINKVGFRTGGGGKAAQSVFPPSIHPSGKQYRWVIHPTACEIAEIPDEVMAKIWATVGEPGKSVSAKSMDHWDQIAKGVGEGCRNETAASLIGRMLGSLKNVFKAEDVQIQWSLVQNWNERNKPPIPRHELESVFKSILQAERRSRTASETEDTVVEHRPWTPESAEIKIEWEVTIVESNPRVYKLRSPLFSHKAPLGYISLNSRQFLSWPMLREQVLEQADVVLAKSLSKVWEGDKDNESLCRKLIETAKFEAAPIEDNRHLVAAEMLWDQIARATVLKDDQQPDGSKMVRTQSGELLFKFIKCLDPMAMSTQKVTKDELSFVLKSIGARDKQCGNATGRRRYKMINSEAEKKLRQMIGIIDDDDS